MKNCNSIDLQSVRVVDGSRFEFSATRLVEKKLRWLRLLLLSSLSLCHCRYYFTIVIPLGLNRNRSIEAARVKCNFQYSIKYGIRFAARTHHSIVFIFIFCFISECIWHAFRPGVQWNFRSIFFGEQWALSRHAVRECASLLYTYRFSFSCLRQCVLYCLFPIFVFSFYIYLFTVKENIIACVPQECVFVLSALRTRAHERYDTNTHIAAQ